MGCSLSKLEDDEAVKLCKDRKKFIKQAVEQRMRFASGHIGYIQSLKSISEALHDYMERDPPHEQVIGSSVTPQAFPSLKKTGPHIGSGRSFSTIRVGSEHLSSMKISRLRSGGNPAVIVEERPPESPDIVRFESFAPIYGYGVEEFFDAQSQPVNPYVFSNSPDGGGNWIPPLPQPSQWDFFWNPFTSLENYGYSNRNDNHFTALDDEMDGLRKVREEEGIPDLEYDESEDESGIYVNLKEEKPESETKIEVNIEDEEDEEYETDNGIEPEPDPEPITHPEVNVPPQVSNSGRIGAIPKSILNPVEVLNDSGTMDIHESNEETPGFTVYVNRQATSMTEVIRDLQVQFDIICQAANEISPMLETSKAQYSPILQDHSAMKVLNPLTLIRSASSRSSSSHFLISSSSRKDESCESSSDISDESVLFSCSHQSTVEKLYAWEKKLYEEVRSGERLRISYEKKLIQLRNQDVSGADPVSVDKTRMAIRDIHTQMNVSIHRICAISKRIESLRDEELQPQLFELAQGLSRMWKVMAECHELQKQTLDEAKHVFAVGGPRRAGATAAGGGGSLQATVWSASCLESNVRRWGVCFQAWVKSLRCYLHSLVGWLIRCTRTEADPLPILGLCVQWSGCLEGMMEQPVVDGLEFFASGMGSVCAQAREGVRAGEMETAEKMAEVAVRVLYAGMSVAVGSFADFAVGSVGAYSGLVRQWGSTVKLLDGRGQAEAEACAASSTL